jgi:hypothetical protein
MLRISTGVEIMEIGVDVIVDVGGGAGARWRGARARKAVDGSDRVEAAPPDASSPRVGDRTGVARRDPMIGESEPVSSTR